MDIRKTELESVLSYEADTGSFRWLVASNNRVKVGKEAGCVDHRGYVVIGAFGSHFLAHRLAWLFDTGEWPKVAIDHINGCRSDNRIANLRLATRSINQENQRFPKSNNRLGFLGVVRDRKRFRAIIRSNGKATHLGTFDSPEEAQAAYVAAKRKIHEGCNI